MPKLKIIRDIVYGDPNEPAHKLDLYKLDGDEAVRPLLVWIHGGGWRGGSRDKVPIRRIVESGFALASISYRFTDKAIFPAQIQDCKGAIRFLRASAERYGYDAQWIGVGGSSAGGHLALLVGTAGNVKTLEGDVGGNLDQSSAVQAIVDYFGPSDFVLRGKTQPEKAYSEKAGSFALLGGHKTGKIDSALERQASPANYVTDRSPPLLMLHGEKDTQVLIDQSERMLDVYKASSRPAELIRVPEGGHGGMVFFMDENYDRVERFFLSNYKAFADKMTDAAK
ncbi:MAG: alpha/beta hydrolase [Aureliella sp.]